MRHDLMEILACPICKGTLELRVETEEGLEIMTGSLHCDHCQEDYPIQDSVPNLLPPNLRA